MVKRAIVARENSRFAKGFVFRSGPPFAVAQRVRSTEEQDARDGEDERAARPMRFSGQI
jgi:hypothetical protein